MSVPTSEDKFRGHGIALLRQRDVLARVGISRSRMYELMARGLFPRPIRSDGAMNRWRSDQIDAYVGAILREAECA